MCRLVQGSVAWHNAKNRLLPCWIAASLAAMAGFEMATPWDLLSHSAVDLKSMGASGSLSSSSSPPSSSSTSSNKEWFVSRLSGLEGVVRAAVRACKLPGFGTAAAAAIFDASLSADELLRRASDKLRLRIVPVRAVALDTEPLLQTEYRPRNWRHHLLLITFGHNEWFSVSPAPLEELGPCCVAVWRDGYYHAVLHGDWSTVDALLEQARAAFGVVGGALVGGRPLDATLALQPQLKSCGFRLHLVESTSK